MPDVYKKDHPIVDGVSEPAIAIQLTDLGKRYNREWIFRHINYRLETGRAYAITGPNGSGKSTLLQAIAGSLHTSEGKLDYYAANNQENTGLIDPECLYRYLAIVAPYMDLVEEMTAKEFLFFHDQFKSFISGISITEILKLIGLEAAADKQIRYFSSGMKQRLKLAQAVFSEVPVLLLDEPCTNLDNSGYELYHSLIADYCAQKLIIVSSNDAMEIDFCTERLHILDYK